MKAILEFNLPEEQDKYDITIMANRMHTVLSDLDYWLRNQIKYTEREELQEIHDRLWELLDDNNVGLI